MKVTRVVISCETMKKQKALRKVQAAKCRVVTRGAAYQQVDIQTPYCAAYLHKSNP